MNFAATPKDCDTLVRRFRLRSLHDKVGLHKATKITNAMAGHGLNQDRSPTT